MSSTTNTFARAIVALAATLPAAALAATSGTVSGPGTISLAPGASTVAAASSAVTITNSPASGDVDVLYMADTTGSMSTPIAGIRNSFTTIANDLATSLPGVNFFFGAAEFKDYSDGAPFSTEGIRVNANLSPSISAAQTGINSWTASGGGDLPEQNLSALQKVGQNWTGSYGGRTSAQKILVWTSDINGWENGAKGFPFPTLQNTINALTATGVQVYSLNVAGDNAGLDQPGATDAMGGPIDGRKQGSTISAATGGAIFQNAFAGSSSTISQKIKDAITTGIDTVGTIQITVTGELGPWTLTIGGTPVVGPFGATMSPVLSDYTLAVTAPGFADTRTVTLNLLADGALLSSTPLTLTTVPEPATLGLIGLGGTLALARRRRAMATA